MLQVQRLLVLGKSWMSGAFSHLLFFVLLLAFGNVADTLSPEQFLERTCFVSFVLIFTTDARLYVRSTLGHYLHWRTLDSFVGYMPDSARQAALRLNSGITLKLFS